MITVLTFKEASKNIYMYNIYTYESEMNNQGSSISKRDFSLAVCQNEEGKGRLLKKCDIVK